MMKNSASTIVATTGRGSQPLALSALQSWTRRPRPYDKAPITADMMIKFKKSLLATFLLPLFLSMVVVCLTPKHSWAWGHIEGYVRSAAGQPIAGAKVTSSLGNVATTMANGSYSMSHVAGAYTITASAQGYLDQGALLTITDSVTTAKDFSLAARPIDITSVSPNWGEMGSNMEVAIQGAGFDANTRVTMALDTGNKRKLLGAIDTPGNAFGVAVVGTTAYVADNTSGLAVIDVSDLANVRLIGAVDTPGSAEIIAVVGTTAYVADGGKDMQGVYQASSLQVINVSDPAHPAIIGAVTTPGHARGVTVVGSTAYVADDVNGLCVIDVSDPAHPTIIGSVDTPGIAQNVTVVNNTAYVADDSSGLQIIDVNPNNPTTYLTIIGAIDTMPGAQGVTVVDHTAYVAAGEVGGQNYLGGLHVIDVSDSAHPAIIGSVGLPYYAESVVVAGSTAYVADSVYSLQMIDVSDPAHPKSIGTVDTPGHAFDVKVVGSTAFVANMDGGLSVIDVSDPAPLPIIGSVDTPSLSQSISVVGSTAYVADYDSGLQIIDVSDPAQPMTIGSVDTPGIAYDVTVVDQKAYVTGATWQASDQWLGSLQVIDENPQSPTYRTIIGSIDMPDRALAVTVVNNKAFVANAKNGLKVIDVSNPAQLRIIGSVDTPGNAYDVTVVGSTAYVADHDYAAGLQVIDVSNPALPQIIGSFDTPDMNDYTHGVTVVGSKAYVTKNEVSDGQRSMGCLQVIDVSDPVRPTLIGSVYTPDGGGVHVTVVGSIAYMSNGEFGLHVIDVANPSHPTIISTLHTPGSARDVTAVGNIAYVADYSAGLTIVPLPEEIEPVTVVSDAELNVTLPSPRLAGHYTLQVLNANQSDELPGAVTFSAQGQKKTPKAIIVAGYGPHASNWLWAETKRNAHYAYNSLLWQGYSKEAIKLLSAENVDADGNGILDDVDGDANLATLQEAVTNWPKDSDEVLIYLVDHGGTGTFELKHTASTVEVLTATTLAGWLNTLQSQMLGRVIVINEFCYSGSFVEHLKVPAGSPVQRIVLTSSKSDEKTKFQQEGRLSFAYQFWAAIFEGAKLTAAFNHAKVMMKDVQTAWLDGNGDGVANTYNEGDLSGIVIGRGVKSAPGSPTIFAVAEPQVLSGGGTCATLWAGEVVSLNPITKAWAVIVPPDYDPSAPDSADDLLPTVELTLTGSGPDKRYEASYDGFTSYGVYKVAYYVMDDKETISQPLSSVVTQSAGADAYEPDDSAAQAGTISLNVATPQTHTFQDANDSDWLKIQGIMGEDYTIEARNLGANNDVVIELYGPDQTTRLDFAHTIGEPRADEYLDWRCSQTGVYYVKFFTVQGLYGPGTEYEASLSRNVGPGFGTLKGTILDSLTLKPIAGASLISSDGASDLTGANGFYDLVAEAGNATLTVRAAGYGDKAQTVQIPANSEAHLDIPLTPLNIPNRAPTAQAGPDRMATGSVTLDAGGSSDPEGEAMTYAWTLTHRTDPAGNRSAGGVSPTVNDLVSGFYDVTLTVTDSEGLTASDSLVLVVAGGGLTQAQLDQAVATAEAAKDEIIGQKDQAIILLSQQVHDKDQLLNRLCISQDLAEGFNLVGFSCPPEGYTAHQFVNALGTASIASIQKFDATVGAFVTVAIDQNGMTTGPDFPLIPGQGYIVYMKQAVQDLNH